MSLREWDRKRTGVKLTEVRILNEQGEKAMGKPMGTYLTLEADRLSKKDDEYHSEISDELGAQLKKLMDQMLKGQERETLSVLVVGLGNPSVTPLKIKKVEKVPQTFSIFPPPHSFNSLGDC